MKRGYNSILNWREYCMDSLFEDYGEAILYIVSAVVVLGMMAAVLGAFTAF